MFTSFCILYNYLYITEDDEVVEINQESNQDDQNDVSEEEDENVSTEKSTKKEKAAI